MVRSQSIHFELHKVPHASSFPHRQTGLKGKQFHNPTFYCAGVDAVFDVCSKCG